MARNHLIYAWWTSDDMWHVSDVESDHESVIVVLERLPALFREVRIMHGLSIDDVVPQIGLSRAALFRFERGREPKLTTILCILRWLTIMAKPSRSTYRESGT